MDTKHHIIVLTKSDIKIKAIEQTFEADKYVLHYVDIPDNINREEQPLFIDGTRTACEQRIEDFLNNFKNNIPLEIDDYSIISIENGLSTRLNPANSQQLSNNIWYDFCMVGFINSVKNPLCREFISSPVMINIEKKYSKPYFEKYYKKNNEYTTLGKYISSKATPLYYKDEPIVHNNWMKSIAGIDRIEQIKRGLQVIRMYIKLYKIEQQLKYTI
jgi:hypothetical protein